MSQHTEIDHYRKILYQQQTDLRTLLPAGDRFDEAIPLFFRQHAQLHTGAMADSGLWSLADAVLGDLSEALFRRIPHNSEHSILWCLWHIARIEDATMNILVAGGDQVFNHGDWGRKMGTRVTNTGNGMTVEEIEVLSKEVDIEALLDYRMTVGRRTRQIAEGLDADALIQPVSPERIQVLLGAGVLAENALGLADYWGNRDIAGLLLMPATRHNMSHLNESLKLRKRRR
jgi:hypothetical protein